MDVYEVIPEFISGMPLVQLWPDMSAVVARATAQKPRDWHLPLVACEAVGGSPELAVPALAAVACAHIGIILIDDMLDADPRGEHERLGLPAAANLASAFQGAALEAIGGGAVRNPDSQLAALRSLQHMMLMTAIGQYLDMQNPVDEVSYWRIVNTKSSPFFGTAMYVGAVLGGAASDAAEQLKEFGALYGEMIQIHDDLSDSLATPAGPDWVQGRSPLPILFAQVVDHPDRARFLDLRRAIPDPDALAEAQAILIRCGALSYGIHELLCRYKRGRELLQEIRLPNRARLEEMLENQVEPVRQLYRAVGAPDGSA